MLDKCKIICYNDYTIKKGEYRMFAEKITLRNGITVIIKEVYGGFEAVTEQDYNARITNARNVMKFNKSHGFKTFQDVSEYLMNL